MHVLLNVYQAMQHGYVCWAEYHPGHIVAGWYELLCKLPHHITEDDPGWNCHTMGNHICGHTK